MSRFSTLLRIALALVLLSFAGCAGPSGELAPEPAPTTSTESAMETPAVEPPAEDAPLSPASWKGAVALPGMELAFSVTFTPQEDGTMKGTIDIPLQGVEGMELADVRYSETELAFTLAPPGSAPPAHAVFACQRSGDTATGTLSQAGQSFELTMELGESQGLVRPQTPTGPFPYTSIEVGYENPADGAHLSGTLTIPESEGPHPAVLLITGSGAQDRDESILGHRPFFVLADHLSRRGVAVLRVDDRGVGGSTGARDDLTTEVFVGDVLTGVAFLGTRAEIDPARIGLIGHSEGGVIAPMAAARSEEVAFIVLLAGTGVRGDELLAQQNRALVIAGGASAEQADALVVALRHVFDVVLDERTDRAARVGAMRALMELQTAIAKSLGQEPPSLDDASVEAALAGIESPWMRSFIQLDPAVALSSVTCPVLAIGGDLDLQVPAAINLAAIAEALEKAGNKDVTTEVMPKLNHLFQTATTGQVAEYAQIEETFAPVALERVTSWVRVRAGLEAGGK